MNWMLTFFVGGGAHVEPNIRRDRLDIADDNRRRWRWRTRVLLQQGVEVEHAGVAVKHCCQTRRQLKAAVDCSGENSIAKLLSFR
jgi:hypothetical protein